MLPIFLRIVGDVVHPFHVNKFWKRIFGEAVNLVKDIKFWKFGICTCNWKTFASKNCSCPGCVSETIGALSGFAVPPTYATHPKPHHIFRRPFATKRYPIISECGI